MSQHVVSVRAYLIVYALLMVLLGATIAVAYVDLDDWGMGPLNLIVSMMIAVVKAILVVLIFMHVRYSTRLTWLASGSALLWLLILIVLTLNDYVTRGWVEIPGK